MAIGVKIGGRKPTLESALARGPFAVEHGVVRRIAVAALRHHGLPEDALEGKSEAFGRAARRRVQRVTLPFVSPIAENLEHVASKKKLRLGGKRRALQIRRVDDVA